MSKIFIGGLFIDTKVLIALTEMSGECSKFDYLILQS